MNGWLREASCLKIGTRSNKFFSNMEKKMLPVTVTKTGLDRRVTAK
jgi:hypothetical protein